MYFEFVPALAERLWQAWERQLCHAALRHPELEHGKLRITLKTRKNGKYIGKYLIVAAARHRLVAVLRPRNGDSGHFLVKTEIRRHYNGKNGKALTALLDLQLMHRGRASPWPQNWALFPR